MHNIVLRVLNHNDKVNRIAITSIAAIGDGPQVNLPATPELRFLKCPKCKHHDFRDGIAINHYECDGCGTGYQVWNA